MANKLSNVVVVAIFSSIFIYLFTLNMEISFAAFTSKQSHILDHAVNLNGIPETKKIDAKQGELIFDGNHNHASKQSLKKNQKQESD